MDNVTHTLVGLTLGQAGLKRRTPLALAALAIGANLPDVDGITYFTGADAIALRRGWTHGPVALLVLPLLAAWLLLLWDRGVRRRGDGRDLPPADGRQLALLGFLAILTHSPLDFLNTYGVRWLMPFRDVWYHGDAWSIMDPWVWLALGLGCAGTAWLERRGRGARGALRGTGPARTALALCALYALVMLGISAAGRRAARAELARAGAAPEAVMVSPAFGDPLRWDVVARTGSEYRLGRLSVASWRVQLEDEAVPVGLEDPAARAAASSPEVKGFLHWARFPVFRVERSGSATLVRISDLRYGREGWASRDIVLPAGTFP